MVSTNAVCAGLSAYNLVENTSVEYSLGSSALKEVVVVVLEAIPVGSELLQAVFVHVGKPFQESALSTS